MLRYAAAAAASKAFSATPTTRRAYRALGNVALGRMRVREGPTPAYVERSWRLIDLCDRHEVLRPGDEVLELGTGWLHWEATILRLFFDVRVTLFDVWDNRLFGAYLAWVERFGPHVAERAELDPERRDRALATIREILTVSSFEELYALLGFRYVVDPFGRLDGLPARHYSLVVSADVLEHVVREILPRYLSASRERLRPGGFAIHQIDLVDHYHYFDPAMSPKHHYRYDDRVWRRWFDNDVQYVNRVQRPEWRALFDAAGFETVEESETSAAMGGIPRAAEFAGLADTDVDCLQMITVQRARP